MRAMDFRHLFSSLSRSLLGPHFHESLVPRRTYKIALTPLFLPSSPSTHFSTIPDDTPVGRGQKGENESDDIFRGKFKFSRDDDDEIMENGPTPIPNRPLRGENRADRSSDPFLRKMNLADELPSVKNARRVPHKFSTQMPNRPMRGEKEESEFDGLFSQKFEGGGNVGDENVGRTRQNHPRQMPNRPMREGDRDTQSTDIFLGKPERSGGVSNDKGAKPTDRNPSPQVPKPESTAPDSLPQDVDEIFRNMKETGLIPNAVAMLDGLCKDGLIQEAMKLFGLMREKGTIPEVVIYTAVVDGFCKAAKFDDANKIFRKMQNNGISPNAFSYTVFIQGLCKGRKLEDSIDFSVEMLEAGHMPNAATFVALIDACCKEKGVEEAGNVIGRLREKGFAIDEKAVREYLDKRGPFSPSVWEVIFGKKNPQRLF